MPLPFTYVGHPNIVSLALEAERATDHCGVSREHMPLWDGVMYAIRLARSWHGRDLRADRATIRLPGRINPDRIDDSGVCLDECTCMERDAYECEARRTGEISPRLIDAACECACHDDQDGPPCPDAAQHGWWGCRTCGQEPR